MGILGKMPLQSPPFGGIPKPAVNSCDEICYHKYELHHWHFHPQFAISWGTMMDLWHIHWVWPPPSQSQRPPGRNYIFRLGDFCKPSFLTVIGRGPHPTYYTYLHSLPENSQLTYLLNIGRAPKGKHHLPTTILQGWVVSFRDCIVLAFSWEHEL